MNAIAELARLPKTIQERKSFVDACVNEILSGDRNPLEFEVMLKSLEDTIKEIRKNEAVKGYVLNEANKYPEKTFAFGNVDITKGSRATNDYSNDGEWVALKAKLKEREEFLKGLKVQMVDPETGDIVNPPIKKHTEFLTIKFKV